MNKYIIKKKLKTAIKLLQSNPRQDKFAKNKIHLQKIYDELSAQGYEEQLSIQRIIIQQRHLFNQQKGFLIQIVSALKAPFLFAARLVKLSLSYIFHKFYSYILFPFLLLAIKFRRYLIAKIDRLAQFISKAMFITAAQTANRTTIETLLMRYGNTRLAKKLCDESLENKIYSNQQDKQFFALISKLVDFIEFDKKQRLNLPKLKKQNVVIVNLVIWGDDFRKVFFDFCLPSLNTDGNFANSLITPYFQIFTPKNQKQKFLDQMQLLELNFQPIIDIREFDDDLIDLAQGDLRYWLYGSLTQLSLFHGYKTQQLVHFLNPDTVYSESFFEGLLKISRGGHWGIFSNSFRTDISELENKLRPLKQNDALSLSADQLTTLAARHKLRMYDACSLKNVSADLKFLPSIPIFTSEKSNGIDLFTLHHHPLLLDCSIMKNEPKLNLFTIDSILGEILNDAGISEDGAYFINGREGIHYLELSQDSQFKSKAIIADEFFERFSKNCVFIDNVRLIEPVHFATSPCSPPDVAQISDNSDIEKLKAISTRLAISNAKLQAKSDFENSFGDLRFNTIGDLISVLRNLDQISKTIIDFSAIHAAIRQLEPKVEKLISEKDQYKHSYYAPDIIELYTLLYSFGWIGIAKQLGQFWEDNHWSEEPSQTQIKMLETQHELSIYISEVLTTKFANTVSHSQPIPSQDQKEKIVFSYLLWGDQFLELFCDFHLISLFSDENRKTLLNHYNVELFIQTTETDYKNLLTNQNFAMIAQIFAIRINIISESLISSITHKDNRSFFYKNYGALDNLGAIYAQQMRAHLFLLPVDSLVSAGTITYIHSHIHQPSVFGGGNVVYNEENIQELTKQFLTDDGYINADAKDLIHANLRYHHQYFSSQLAHTGNKNFGRHAREIFHFKDNQLKINSVFIHPLFVHKQILARYRCVNFVNVDYGMIPRMVKTVDEIHVPPDISKMYISNSCMSDRVYEVGNAPFHHLQYFEYHQDAWRVQRQIFSKTQKIEVDIGHFKDFNRLGIAQIDEITKASALLSH